MVLITEASWWKMLKEKELFEMSFVLAQKALPAWNDFTHPREIKHELKQLPGNALREIEVMLNGFNNTHKLNEHFTSFITPVIQMRDGHLKYPYEVRQAFLSVFHILHGLVSTNSNAAKHAFSASISKALDAIKIGEILTLDEIALLTQKYYLLSQAS